MNLTFAGIVAIGNFLSDRASVLLCPMRGICPAHTCAWGKDQASKCYEQNTHTDINTYINTYLHITYIRTCVYLHAYILTQEYIYIQVLLHFIRFEADYSVWKLTEWGRVTQIWVFTLQLCKTDDANLRL